MSEPIHGEANLPDDAEFVWEDRFYVTPDGTLYRLSNGVITIMESPDEEDEW